MLSNLTAVLQEQEALKVERGKDRERERERERGADFESGVRISSENARLLRARCCSDPKFDFDRLVVLLA